MQINLTGHHVDVTPELRDYVTRKFERITRHFENVTNVRVILTVERQSHKAEATVHVAGADLFANALHTDMHGAIDTLADKIDGQVRRHKDKVTDHHRGDGGIKTRFG